MPRPLSDWQQGDIPGAGHLNEVIHVVRDLMARGDTIAREFSSYTPVLVKITSNATGGGKYNGRILDGNASTTATGNLSLPESMTVPTSNDCLVINLSEDGTASHTIAASSYANGLLVGTTTAALRVVAVAGANGGGSGVVIRIAANETGCGKYGGYIQVPTMNSNPAVDLVLPAGMSDGEHVLVVNSGEDGEDTGLHILGADDYMVGAIVGYASDGRRAVLVDNLLTPVSVDDVFVHRMAALDVIAPLTVESYTGGNIEISTDGYTGDITNVTDVAYNTTTHILKFTKQTLTFTKGVLTTVGSTSDTTIDTAVSCV